jgi:hypothetical protein
MLPAILGLVMKFSRLVQIPSFRYPFVWQNSAQPASNRTNVEKSGMGDTLGLSYLTARLGKRTWLKLRVGTVAKHSTSNWRPARARNRYRLNYGSVAGVPPRPGIPAIATVR